MKTKMKFMMSLLLVFSITITSCSKDGDVGPAGIAGTNGANGTDGVNGADGVDGTDGVDGADGNANVIASDWIELDFGTEWESSIFIGQYASDEILDNRISQEVHDSYVMLAYLKNTNDTRASSLPVNYTFANDVTIDGYFYIGSITVQATRNSEAGSEAPPTQKSLRYVLIAPSGMSGKQASLDYSSMTYEEVMDHFGLD